MNLRERFNRTMHFQNVDNVINMEFGYWDETLEKWHKEGLPQNLEKTKGGYHDSILNRWYKERISPDIKYIIGGGERDPLAEFFGMDVHWRSCFASIDNVLPLPAFEDEILEEDEETRIIRTAGGVILRTFKRGSSVPHYIKFPVETRKDFEELKIRFNPDSPGRYPPGWNNMVKEFNSRDYPLGLNMNGFFGQIRNWMGFENLSYAWYDQPELIKETCEFWADFNIKVSRRVFEEVELDFVHFWEDMAYNHGPMISPEHFRQFLVPAYKKVVEFIKSCGIDVIIVDSDGLIDELLPLFLEVGINAVLPVEIAAGSDPVVWRKRYGQDLRLIGGIDKRALARGQKAIDEELRDKVSYLVSKGGYIPAVDHLVPPDVSLDNYKLYLELKKEILQINK